MTQILNLIYIGAKIFSDERQEYFKSRSKKLMEEIQQVEDSDFYKKDMEAKGKAQRALKTQEDELYNEYVKEATK